MSNSPFELSNRDEYLDWREQKLSSYPKSAKQLIVELSGADVTLEESQSLIDCCRKTNMVIYRLSDSEAGNKTFVRDLGQLMGLEHLDGNLCADNDSITSLQVMDTGRHTGYIPYTNRRLSWHTDGYYNTPEHNIRGILMHCARPAMEGGENLLLDPEIAYIQLRDENPEYIKAFMREDAMTIPPNVENGIEIRGEQGGPVFSIEPATGNLHMRFSARTRNIIWHDDEITKAAVTCLNELLTPNNPYVFTYRLNRGEGIICNNVLHCRTGFTDGEASGETRLLYRARYYDRVAHTDFNH